MRASPASFHLGVNFPWLNYAQDFGRTPAEHLGISRLEAQRSLDQEFAKIRDCGAGVVRWFVFGDGRGGFLTEKGIPRRPDEFLLQDVAAALQLAHRHGLKLCFSLIDYLWLQDRPENRASNAPRQVLQFAAGREALLDRVFIPLFREFWGHPALFAWEIANEPEWAIREFHHDSTAHMHYADFRVFAEEIARAVHEFGDVDVTLGSARIQWVRAWSELGLDFYQAHFYPSLEGKSDLAAQLAELPPLDQPLWLGELPANQSSSSNYLLQNALTDCKQAGLCGAAVWRWSEPEKTGADAAIGRLEPSVLLHWSQEKRAASVKA